jgi:hypothetical protein
MPSDNPRYWVRACRGHYHVTCEIGDLHLTYIRIATAVTKHEAVNTLVLARGGVYAPITRDGQTYRMVPRSR